jgi:nucleoside-diphosphate-sugar epimerase
MIYGAAGDRNLSRLLALLARFRPAPVPLVVPVPGGGLQLQQPVHVADLAEAVLAAVERTGAAGHRYDVAGPEPLTFAELLRGSAAAVGCRIRLVPVPMAPVVALTRGYERISRRPRIRVEQWQRLAEDKAFGIEAAARDLDYAARSFTEGIRAEAAALGLTRTTTPQAPASPGPSSPTLTRRSHA